MRRADVGIRIRADAKFARLVDEAARLCGDTRSGFIRHAALEYACHIIHEQWKDGASLSMKRNWARTVSAFKAAEDEECTPTQSR